MNGRVGMPLFLIACLGWALLALPWFLVDGWMAAWPRLSGDVAWVPDLSVVLLLVAGLHVRPRAVTAFLVCAAGARSLVMDGSLSLHFLALGLPVALLIATRSVVVERSLLWQVACALFVALVTPRLTGFLGRLTDEAVAVCEVDGVVLARAVLWGPPLAFLVSRVPPVRMFTESRLRRSDVDGRLERGGAA